MSHHLYFTSGHEKEPFATENKKQSYYNNPKLHIHNLSLLGKMSFCFVYLMGHEKKPITLIIFAAMEEKKKV